MSNAYESGQQKLIPAVLLYAFHGHELLMIHRNIKQHDFHEGKWNGLGGKLEAGESFIDTAVREFEEEAGVTTEKPQWRWTGQLYFPNFKPAKNEDWLVNVFVTDLTPEQKNSISENDVTRSEGTLHWIPLSRVLCLNLWDGDQHFLPSVLNRKKFEGTFFYEGGKCSRFLMNVLA